MVKRTNREKSLEEKLKEIELDIAKVVEESKRVAVDDFYLIFANNTVIMHLMEKYQSGKISRRRLCQVITYIMRNHYQLKV